MITVWYDYSLMWLQVGWKGQDWSPSNSWSLSHCFLLMSSTEEEEWRNDSFQILTISKTLNQHWTTHRSQTTQKYSALKTSHQTRLCQRDQRDFGLKAQMVVKLLRATDSSTRFHCSGDFCLCFLIFCVFLKENLFSIVNFPNSPCVGTSGVEGTCYTASQCTSRVWPSLAFHHQQPWPLSVSIWKATFCPLKICTNSYFFIRSKSILIQGGSSDGSCAAGFGTCCTFTAPCDSEITQNGTYFSRYGLLWRQVEISHLLMIFAAQKTFQQCAASWSAPWVKTSARLQPSGSRRFVSRIMIWRQCSKNSAKRIHIWEDSVEVQPSSQKVLVSSARCAWISKKWNSLTRTQQGLAALTICKSLVGLARLVVFTIVTDHNGQVLQGTWLHPHSL